ncbi:MAG: type IV secretory system conjugative DNA transfer family protein [Alphaproteobacteria bacterium]|nr:type IV secretory system conjugative DNA transfer family protein [Alphaproteobacteria bacterium]
MAKKLNLLSVSGKGLGFGIFDSSKYSKDHDRLRNELIFWKFRWVFFMFLASMVVFGLSFAAEHVFRYGMSPAAMQWIAIYFDQVINTGGIRIFAEVPAWISRIILRPDFPAVLPLIPIAAFYLMTFDTFLSEINPYGKDIWNEHTARKANQRDIDTNTFLKNGFITVLGYWKKKPMMLNETLSTLCVAPPGTGKTSAVVIPTIYECDTVSMIINDPKPELDEKTSGYRATLGPTFIINWAGQDDPEKGLYYPSWNPLSPEHVPFVQEKRDLYIDSICTTLIADKASSTADPHWTISGRAALSGLVQFMVSKIERAKWSDYFLSRLKDGTFDDTDRVLLDERYAFMQDPNAYAARQMLQNGTLNADNFVPVGTWATIPTGWIGKEPSMSLILDWLNSNQIRVAEQVEERRKQGDQMAMMTDKMADLFNDAVEEARRFGYAHRAVLELTQLANTPDKERGSILSTVLAGLSIFRNAAVRNRTSHSTFHFEDMRGIKNTKTGKWEPVTVYLSVNLVDAQALNPITAIFIELMSDFLITNVPDAMYAGKQLGPQSVLFVLDEMPKMQKMDAVIKGPDLGRGQKVSYLIIGQDLRQIQEKYGADAAGTIMSTTAAKIIMRQNDFDAAQQFSKLIGQKIKEKADVDKDSKIVKGYKKGDPEDLYSAYDIMKMSDKKQIVLLQGYYNRPIEVDQFRAHDNEKFAKKRNIPQSSPLPENLIPAHHAAMGYPGTPKVYDFGTKETREIKSE